MVSSGRLCSCLRAVREILAHIENSDNSSALQAFLCSKKKNLMDCRMHLSLFKKLLTIHILKRTDCIFRQHGKGFIFPCKAKYKWYSLEIESDLVAVGARWCKDIKFMVFQSRCFFQAVNVVMQRHFFPDCQYIYLDIIAQKDIPQAVLGRTSVLRFCSCKEQLVVEECIF